MRYDALDHFAGAGGWSLGAHMIGLRDIGIDHDQAACATATANGFDRVRADVATYPLFPFAGVPGHISSPPCTLFSTAGKGTGREALGLLCDAVVRIFAGDDCRAEVRDTIYRLWTLPARLAENIQRQANFDAGRSKTKPWSAGKVESTARSDAFITALVLEPARAIVELGPEWVAMEQVPALLPVWLTYARCLRERGYSAYAVVLNAANYGVPQTRERAILGASRVRVVVPPEPTHAKSPEPHLFGELEKWVSMADALGAAGFPGWSDDSTVKPARGSGLTERHGDRPAHSGDRPAHSGDRPAHSGDRPAHSGDRPAPVVISKARSWVVDRRTNSKAAGGQWVLRSNKVEWFHERPATTIVGSFGADVVSAPGYRLAESRQNAEGGVRITVAEGGVRITVAEGGVLQSFPADFIWTGSRSKQFEGVGNAIPPRLAAHTLGSVVGVPDYQARIAEFYESLGAIA